MGAVDDTRELVKRVLAGDVEAFGTLVQRHELAVRAFMAARLADRHEAEDLAQEVFVTAYQKLASFDATQPMAPWLRGVATNILRNRLRRRSEATGREIEALLDDRVAKLEEDHGGAPRVVALRRCLETLAPHARDLVERRYARGESLAELSRHLAKRHSALTMSLYRVRAQLRECIERRLGPAGGQT